MENTGKVLVDTLLSGQLGALGHALALQAVQTVDQAQTLYSAHCQSTAENAKTGCRRPEIVHLTYTQRPCDNNDS